jgi:hypothetical protein
MKSDVHNRALEDLARAVAAAERADADERAFAWLPASSVQMMAEIERALYATHGVNSVLDAERIAALVREVEGARNTSAHFHAVPDYSDHLVLVRQQYDKLLKLSLALHPTEVGTVDADVDSPIDDDSIEASVRVQTPPGYWMERIARMLCFFSPKGFRVYEETVGDYRWEMIDAEAKRRGRGTMRELQFRHWGGFIGVVVEQLLTGLVGRIIKALKGG